MSYTLSKDKRPVSISGKKILAADFTGVEVKNVNTARMELTGVASAEIADLQGDIVRLDGLDTKSFFANPVMLSGHDYGSFPIAKVTKIWRDTKDGIKRLLFTAQFDKGQQVARDIFGSYVRGFSKAFSIGFMAIKSKPIESEKEKSYFHDARDFLESRLIEISCCAIGANPAALVGVSIDAAVCHCGPINCTLPTFNGDQELDIEIEDDEDINCMVESLTRKVRSGFATDTNYEDLVDDDYIDTDRMSETELQQKIARTITNSAEFKETVLSALKGALGKLD